jgi:hypothetical protein
VVQVAVLLLGVLASGSSNLRSGDQYWGYIVGPVTKGAARIRVLFDMGIPPLDLTSTQSRDRFPVNFYAGFYRQPAKDTRPATCPIRKGCSGCRVGYVSSSECGSACATG